MHQAVKNDVALSGRGVHARKRLAATASCGEGACNRAERDGLRKRRSKRYIACSDVARPARFERATFRLGGGRSILLSYGRICKILDFADEQTRTDRSRYGHILRSHMTYSVINCQDADNYTFFREEHAQRIWWIVFKLLPKEHAELIICYESCFVNADYESILILAMRH